MKPLYQVSREQFVPMHRQRGVVLFIALIALVTLMLAAVALVRSVDTSALISGNLAFKQAATTGGDSGITLAINRMKAIGTANAALNPTKDAGHPFNTSDPANGYYSWLDSALDLKAAATWAPGASYPPAGTQITDANGNTIRYIIQRMCKNSAAGALAVASNCVYSASQADKETHDPNVVRPVTSGSSPLNRVTVQITGPRNTVSYVQAFIY
jgi:type IV pilus assembly protein PilX